MDKRVSHYEIALAGPSEEAPASITATILDWTADGRRHRPCTVVVEWHSGRVEATSTNMFHAFQKARIALEERGLFALCQGAKPAVRVSGMLVDMADGLIAYDFTNHVPGDPLRTVCIFDSAAREEIGSVSAQADRWKAP